MVFGISLDHEKQLLYCRIGRKKNFGYVSILVAFFFKRILALSPTVTLPPFPPHDPRIMQVGDVFLHKGGVEVQGVYDDDFYMW